MFKVSVIFDDGTHTTHIVSEENKVGMFARFADMNNAKGRKIEWRSSKEILALDGDKFAMSIQAISLKD